MTKVCVIGAGVTGLSAAFAVLDAVPNVSLTVLADKFNADTTSAGAAGVLRPEGYFFPRGSRWSSDTYKHLISLHHSKYGPEAGVIVNQGYLISNDYSDIQSQNNVEGVYGWREIRDEELRQFPGDWKYGMSFLAVAAECRKYLPFLTKRIEKLGGKLRTRFVHSFEELADDYDIVINCTGLEARNLCSDPLVHPIRGQVFRVIAPWQTFAVWASVESKWDTYIIPNLHNVVVGGVRQADNYSTEIDSEDSAAIWARAIKLQPGLKRSKIEREWVGLRPARHGGVRLEIEDMKFGSGKTIKVIHNYGHGGSGIQASWGCALEVVEMVKSLIMKDLAHRGGPLTAKL